MRSQKEEPMAAIQLSYHKILVPLSIAHQLQALLTQATLVTSNYGTPNKQYTLELDYEVPNVEVWRTPRVLFDAKGMGAPQVRNWEEEVRKAMDADDDVDAANCVSPKCWLKIKGETK
jgi:hypothetical protein